MPLLSIYCEKTCILCHSFHQNDHFRTMGHATKLTFVTKYFFFAEFKCVYKASLIICLHKYVNNSIYVFEPKFKKSRPMFSLKDIRFIYSFRKILESVGVRDQARFVEVSTTSVTRAMIISVSTRCQISKNEAIRNVNFKRRGLICENMTKFQPSDVRRHQSEVVS